MRRTVISPLVGALIFLGPYLAVSPASGPLQRGPMPLPGAPEADVFAYQILVVDQQDRDRGGGGHGGSYRRLDRRAGI